MYDNSTTGLETPDRENASLFERTDCPECGRPLTDHGLTTTGPGRTRLAPCGFDVAGVPVRDVAQVLDDSADVSAKSRVVADGGQSCAAGDGRDESEVTGDAV
ncbi:hypothetical protein [Halobaculum sp. P14]|uniref:hypothetical protein n=1 Tax=Halobaculum sp. P14 TaxID=3421638 RepID=UPI003EB80D45